MASTLAGVPATRSADTVVEPVTVVKMTCGTVNWVDRMVVTELEGMMDPEEIPVLSIHGTVKVV